ncbi:alkaline phosphatase [Marmoricola sp. Leaf446]|uniref:alkaline phosphatase D family protein n=1 Tax=Marmoricola sp. Leaf446 TaxID=1736379 RepID=UPI0006FA3D9A|nr:alkaline phosphatase D family protein [Marmoricola sp. Leaf446]KQT94116.1 alkaline phosphatase [Marmoricola sp. Leaf446]
MTSRPSLSRRHLLAGSAGVVAAGALSRPTGAVASRTAPGQLRTRLALPDGVQTGDVTSRSAVLWSRASGEGRLVARVGSGRSSRVVRGPWATPDTDLTARIELEGLAPGRAYDAALWFEGPDGTRGEVGRARFSTGDRRPAATSFVWTGDTAGQGWGINPDLGGMTAYAAMHATRPDFFVHAGDTIYADGPIAERVVEPDGQVWRNLVTPEVSKVAETLREFRGRHRYNLMDANVRAFYADTPVVAQWDDHETVNNWWPGEVLDDARYTERRVDVLAARARRAWQEYQPIATGAARGRGRSGFAEARIYRRIERGAHLDVFCLDMRTHKSPNTAGLEPRETPVLGREQAEWLVREVRRSRATWKVISADLPLGLVVPDGAAQESVSNGDPGAPLGRELELARVLSGLKGVPGVLWITADVHYCAAHHYSPERATSTDFDPFWEVVAGPINAGTFGPSRLDGTFGPRQVFARAADYPNQSPRGGNQFFGHVDIARSGLLTVSLRDARGTVLWTRDLEPGQPATE